MDIPIISIVGKSDAGKTTLIEKLVHELCKRNYKVATIKHDVHGFEIDHKGKDSYRHKHSGAHITIISSPKQIAMIKDSNIDHEIDEINEMYISDVNIVLTEGYKKNNKPKIEIHRKEAHQELLCNTNDNVIAIATNENLDIDIPQYDINDSVGLVDLIEKKFLNQNDDNIIKLIVNGKSISLKPFITRMLVNAIKGMVKALKGCQDAEEITIKISDTLK